MSPKLAGTRRHFPETEPKATPGQSDQKRLDGRRSVSWLGGARKGGSASPREGPLGGHSGGRFSPRDSQASSNEECLWACTERPPAPPSHLQQQEEAEPPQASSRRPHPSQAAEPSGGHQQQQKSPEAPGVARDFLPRQAAVDFGRYEAPPPREAPPTGESGHPPPSAAPFPSPAAAEDTGGGCRGGSPFKMPPPSRARTRTHRQQETRREEKGWAGRWLAGSSRGDLCGGRRGERTGGLRGSGPLRPSVAPPSRPTVISPRVQRLQSFFFSWWEQN